MLARIRTLHRRAVVVGALVLLSLLGVAPPAQASHWSSVSSYTTAGECRERGEDLLFSGVVSTFRCYRWTDSRKRQWFLLRVKYFHPGDPR